MGITMMRKESDGDDEVMMGKARKIERFECVREPCRSFGRRCSRLVKEQRAKFYILRRCVAMLVCWHDCGDA
ncbi:hypothetical protein Syun_016288 [Stephania yunnanensis]|uniref:Uncharacterized protein n=1 Tax=Stephania yunnanensis TaxID=152371 RepID=A0AAP0J4L5_9MAGN